MYFKKYLIEILLVINIILVLGIYGLYIYEKINNYNNEMIIESETLLSDNAENTMETKEENITVEPAKQVYAEIKGAVKNPGVYKINENSIVNDIVKKAGGFSKNAYTDNINLSKKVSDELLIYVYTKEDYSLKKDENKENICICPTYDVTKCVEDKSSVIETKTTEVQDNLVNINLATKEQLESLSGIGEAKANSIIEYRNANGNFSKIEDIMKVNGISENLYAKIKENITV